MSEAIKCDRCGKYDDIENDISCLKRKDINYGDIFQECSYPDNVDLCQPCTKELLAFIRDWIKLSKNK